MPCDAFPDLNSGKCFQRLGRHGRRVESSVEPRSCLLNAGVFSVDTGHPCTPVCSTEELRWQGVSSAPLSHDVANGSCFENYTNRWTVSVTSLLLGGAYLLTALFFPCWSASGLQGNPGSQWHGVGPLTTGGLLLTVDCCSGLWLDSGTSS